MSYNRANGPGLAGLNPSYNAPVGTASVNKPKPTDPLIQAANIQADALGNAIPLFDPYREAGITGLEQFQQGSTPEGLDQLLAMIMGGDGFSMLKDERVQGAEAMLGSGGLTRSGTALETGAGIGGNLALQLESLLSGKQGALADTGYGATSNIADLTTQIGEAIASGILGVESRDNARSANRSTNKSNLLGSIIGGAFSLSDPSLKENITKLSEVGPLGFYSWSWIDETKGTIAENMPTEGFLSTEVKKYYPEFVKEFGSFDMINYQGLIEHLRGA